MIFFFLFTSLSQWLRKCDRLLYNIEKIYKPHCSNFLVPSVTSKAKMRGDISAYTSVKRMQKSPICRRVNVPTGWIILPTGWGRETDNFGHHQLLIRKESRNFWRRNIVFATRALWWVPAGLYKRSVTIGWPGAHNKIWTFKPVRWPTMALSLRYLSCMYHTLHTKNPSQNRLLKWNVLPTANQGKRELIIQVFFSPKGMHG